MTTFSFSAQTVSRQKSGSGRVNSFPCPKCNGKTGVTDSRPSPAQHAIRRRRQCETCGERFTTFEAYVDRHGSNPKVAAVQKTLTELAAIQAKLERQLADLPHIGDWDDT